MRIGSSVAKWAQPMITTRKQHETLGLDGLDLVIERRGLVSRGVVAAADTIRDSLAFYFIDHA